MMNQLSNLVRDIDQKQKQLFDYLFRKFIFVHLWHATKKQLKSIYIEDNEIFDAMRRFDGFTIDKDVLNFDTLTNFFSFLTIKGISFLYSLFARSFSSFSSWFFLHSRPEYQLHAIVIRNRQNGMDLECAVDYTFSFSLRLFHPYHFRLETMKSYNLCL